MRERAQREDRVSRRVAVIIWIAGSIVLWLTIVGITVTSFHAGKAIVSHVLSDDKIEEGVMNEPAHE